MRKSVLVWLGLAGVTIEYIGFASYMKARFNIELGVVPSLVLMLSGALFGFAANQLNKQKPESKDKKAQGVKPEAGDKNGRLPLIC